MFFQVPIFMFMMDSSPWELLLLPMLSPLSSKDAPMATPLSKLAPLSPKPAAFFV